MEGEISGWMTLSSYQPNQLRNASIKGISGVPKTGFRQVSTWQVAPCCARLAVMAQSLLQLAG
jgi:hypothetical protein